MRHQFLAGGREDELVGYDETTSPGGPMVTPRPTSTHYPIDLSSGRTFGTSEPPGDANGEEWQVDPRPMTIGRPSGLIRRRQNARRSTAMDQKNLADLYGLDPIPWSRALEALEATDPQSRTFLATTRPDGRPHVAGVGALWDEGRVYFVSGAGTRKSRNVAQNA